MAEFDDERSDFDDVFADPPEDAGRDARREARRAGGEDTGPIDTDATGEVPRPRSSAPLDPPPEFDDSEPAPPPRRSRGSGSSGGGSRSGGSGRSRSSSRSRSGGGGRGGSGASGGVAVLQGPRGRLILGIAFAVVLVIVIALVVKDCQRSQLEDSYTSYVNGVSQIVTKSAEEGAALRQVMANPRGDNPPQLQAKINAIAKNSQALVDQAEDLDPPGALKGAQASLVTALEYRVTGLTTLSENLPALLQRDDLQTKAAGISKPMQRFLASDVIYEDSFKGPAMEALKKDDITGVEVPPLQAFLPNAGLASAEGAKALVPDLQRRTTATGGDAAGNLRGTSLESTIAKPSDTRLTVGQTATVQATEDLKWSVTVKNGGDFDESNVVVKASFSYPASPNDVDTREVAIKSMPSGQTVSVLIPGPASDKIVFGDQGTLVIEVVPVTGETRIDNNKAEYPVKITI
jgi:hypothetical protein